MRLRLGWAGLIIGILINYGVQRYWGQQDLSYLMLGMSGLFFGMIGALYQRRRDQKAENKEVEEYLRSKQR